MKINFNNDTNQDDELFLNLKQKSLNQKFIYFDTGAEVYYANEFYTPVSEEFIQFTRSQVIEKPTSETGSTNSVKTAFVSLGCGNCFEESRILAEAKENVTLFAVDSSVSMLKLSEKILANFAFNKVLIEADFTTDAFRENLDDLLKDYQKRVFYFSGFTFCNFDSGLISLLSKIMQSGDILIFYVVTIVKLHMYTKLFIDDSRNALKNREKMNAYFEPLKKFKIPQNNGKIMMDSFREKDIGSLGFQYYFRFNRKTKISYNGEITEFQQGDKIALQNIRIYDYETFMKFFELKKFKLLALDVYESINVIYAFEKSEITDAKPAILTG